MLPLGQGSVHLRRGPLKAELGRRRRALVARVRERVRVAVKGEPLAGVGRVAAGRGRVAVVAVPGGGGGPRGGGHGAVGADLVGQSVLLHVALREKKVHQSPF